MTENKKNLKKPVHKLSNVTSVRLSATNNECTVSQNNCTPRLQLRQSQRRCLRIRKPDLIRFLPV